ncbi:uncharacterized protein C3orf38 homolog [Rhopilema esculentum]|uniref:uncharacterized protein C3orf38 homolog n=1 Tax=Rhopilema esculentum TaxID=499914 RepID=UPI0031DFCBDA|eukprot:gene6166-11562_t
MLAEFEKACCRKLLDLLSDEELKGLSQTVTQNSIHVSSRTEAIEAILQYSESAHELLHRQKLKKDHLKAYAVKYGEQSWGPLIVKSDKATIVKLLTDSWKYPPDQTVEKKEESTYREDEKESQKIATSFVNWFYNILNSTQALPDSKNWGPQHFWNDAKLEFTIDRPDGTSCDEVVGADEVSRTLALFVSNFKGLFNPNMSSEGVRSEMSHHGLLAVKSAGTIHKSSSVVGLYEQTFGLIQDPLTGGNWKIKNTKLQIKLNSCLSNALSYS